MKQSIIRFLIVAALMVLAMVNAWGQVSSAAPANGKSFVVAAYVSSKYYALPNGTVNGGQISGVEISLNSQNKVNTSDASGKTWTLEEGSGDNAGRYYFTYKVGNETYYLYKNGTGKTNYNFAVNKTSKNYWSFTNNGSGYTVTAIGSGDNNLNINCSSGTFSCRSTGTPILLIEVGDVSSNTPSITADNVNIDYDAKSGSIAYTLQNGSGNVSADVTEGSDWLAVETITSSAVSFTCSANTTTEERTATVTLSYTGASNKVVTITQAAAPTPSISANNVNIAFNATSGSIAYSVENGSENVTASVTSGDWLSLGTITSSEVPFNCSANTAATARTAHVKLSYTGASDKDVTVTQAAAPLANIAALVESGAKGRVQLTNALVTYKSGTTAYIEDESGAIMLYQCATSDLAIGDKITGVMNVTTYEVYNGLPEIKEFTLETGYEKTTGNTVTPTEVTIATLLDNNTNYSSWISRYVVIKNATVTSAFSSKNSTIEQSGSSITLRDQNSSATLTSTVDDVVNVTGNVGIYNSTKQIALWAQSQIVVVQDPTIAVASSLVIPNYVVGTAEPTYETLTVNGSNLTADITLTLGDNSNFELSEDLDTWTNTLSLTQSDGSVTNAEVAVRLKADLSKGSYDGTLTLSSTGATNKTVSLSGSVTGQTYEIAQYSTPSDPHGTINFSPESPIEEGTEVTLSATPADGYDFMADSWAFYKQSGENWVADNNITVSNSKFTMPEYALQVDATFAAKTTYAISTVVTPDNSGTVVTDKNAWEGKTVSVEVEAAAGYAFSSIVVTKTDDSSTSIPTSGTANAGFTFTMPAYPVTVTVAFNAVYSGSGSFIKYTSAISEGYYVITYDDYALKNSVSSNRFENGSFTVSNNTITNPNVNIVWKIQANGNYWTLYNEAESKYAAGTGSKNQGALISSVTDLAKWTVTVSNGEFQFENLGRSNASTDSGNKWLRNNGTNGWACYASSTGGALTLYKLQDSSTPAVILENTSVETTPAFAEGTITVNCLNIESPTLEVLFYESNGSTSATYNWLTASINGDGNVAYTINANTGEARTAYFKVHETTNDVFSELVTVTQALYVIDYASLPFEYDGNGTGTLPTGFTCDGLKTYSSSPKMQFNDTGDWAILKVNETPGVLSFDIKGNSFSEGTFTVQTSDDGITYTDLAEYTELGTTQTKTFVNLSTTVRYIKWIYTEKVNGNVALGNIKLYNAIPATAATVLSENKYVTSFYSGTKNYQLSEGALAYTVGLVNDKLVFYRIGEASNVIPKGNAVVIISSDESIKYTEIKDNEVPAGTTIHAGNKLKGRDTDYTPEGTVYVLGIDNNNGIGFYKLKPGTTIPAGKAYYEAE